MLSTLFHHSREPLAARKFLLFSTITSEILLFKAFRLSSLRDLALSIHFTNGVIQPGSRGDIDTVLRGMHLFKCSRIILSSWLTVWSTSDKRLPSLPLSMPSVNRAFCPLSDIGSELCVGWDEAFCQLVKSHHRNRFLSACYGRCP